METNRENQNPDNQSSGVRASDAERERVAKMVNDAAGEGRLTLDEAGERLERIYATRYRAELNAFVEDLPGDRRESMPIRDPGGRFPARLRIHAAIVVVLSVLLVVRWATLDVPYFFPAFPMFFLFLSLLAHARFTAWARRGGPPWRRGYGGPPWRTPRQEATSQPAS